MFRRRMSRGASRRNFRRGAKRVHKKNRLVGLTRGGRIL